MYFPIRVAQGRRSRYSPFLYFVYFVVSQFVGLRR